MRMKFNNYYNTLIKRIKYGLFPEILDHNYNISIVDYYKINKIKIVSNSDFYDKVRTYFICG